MSVNIWYWYFFFWPTSLCMTVSRFIHICKQSNFVCFYSWVIFHCIYLPHLLYPFLCQCSLSLFPCCQFNSVAQSCLTVCNPMDSITSGFPVHHQLLELAEAHVHRVGNAIQPSHPLSSPSPPAFNLSQHQGLFQWVSSSHQVAKVLEFQLQHQSFQWIFRMDFL